MAVSVIEVTQSATNGGLANTVSGTHGLTLSASPVAGDVVVVVTKSTRGAGARSVTGVTGLGASWAAGYAGTRVSFWLGTGATSAGSVTVTLSGAGSAQATLYLIRGLTATTVTGVTSTASGTALTGTAQTADAGQVVVGGAAAVASGLTYPSAETPSGWTSLPVVSGNNGDAYRVPSASASHSTSLTNSASGQVEIGSIVLGDVASSSGSPVTVAAPALTLSVAVAAPTVRAGTAVAVAAPALALSVQVLAPVVVVGGAVTVQAPAMVLSFLTAQPSVVVGSGVTVAAPALVLTVSTPDPVVDVTAPAAAGLWRDAANCVERWVSAPVIAPPSERTRWREDADSLESMVFDPRAVATPPTITDAPIKRLGMKMPAMSSTYRKPVPFEGGFDIERGDVGRLQTIIGGRNVTFLRDVPTTLDRFASEGPMCDTQATIRLPLDPWDEVGEADLAHVAQDAAVDVILVRPDGTTEHKWEGFVSAHDDNTSESGEDYTVQCEGLFMQAAHWPWDPPVIAELRDVGHVVADALNSVPNRRWRTVPRVTTGILTSERGQQGWSTWQFVQTVLGKAWTDDGRQWSLTRMARRTYRLTLKASTVAPTFTITKGAPGVDISLRRDFSTRRDAIFARGYAPDGGYWCGRVFPSLDFGVPPRYPFNNASINISVGTRDRDTDTGNGVTLWQRQMRDLGYPVTVDGVMNTADTKWVYRIQRDKGITVDGSLGPQTWNATFEDNSHDADLTTYRVPLAFNSDVWPFRYSASGARGRLVTIGAEAAILHAMPEVDWGTDIRKTSAVEPTKRMLEREKDAGWTGTVTLRSDPWEAGSSRLDIREGHNLLILGHYGGTVVQVASADHQDDASVFSVDTKARDAMSLDAIRDRDREARRDAAGRGNSTDRSKLNNAQVVQYESESKAGFVSRTAVNGNTGLWSVRKAFVSQVGVAKVEFNAVSPKAELVVAIFNRPIRTSVLASLAPDPLADDDKWYEHEQVLKDKYGLMEIFGSSDNPGGYYPRQKGKGPLTGKLRDEAGLPYDSPYGGFVWVAMFTSRSTWVEGRVFPAVPQ